MGTTLTGTTPQDTYDSLIKVTDNGPLSGTLKRITDGLGNDSALSLSTAAARVTGNLTVKSTTERANITTDADLVTENGIGVVATSTSYGQGYQYIRFMNSAGSYSGSVSHTASTGLGLYSGSDLILGSSSTERVRIDTSGNVGIGTASPSEVLHVKGNQRISALTGNSVSAILDLYGNNGGAFGGSNVVRSRIQSFTAGDAFSSIITFSTNDSSNVLQERVRIDSDGLKFNGDTAAANALDDYEEGTYTVTLTPSTSGTISLNASYNTWTYTKIGRQVVARGVAIVSSVSSPVGGVVYINLPLTNQNVLGAYGSVKVDYYNTAASPVFQTKSCYIAPNQAQCILQVDASTVASGHEIYVTATYFV